MKNECCIIEQSYKVNSKRPDIDLPSKTGVGTDFRQIQLADLLKSRNQESASNLIVTNYL